LNWNRKQILLRCQQEWMLSLKIDKINGISIKK
jgi:hypothetical protein